MLKLTADAGGTPVAVASGPVNTVSTGGLDRQNVGPSGLQVDPNSRLTAHQTHLDHQRINGIYIFLCNLFQNKFI